MPEGVFTSLGLRVLPFISASKTLLVLQSFFEAVELGLWKSISHLSTVDTP